MEVGKCWTSSSDSRQTRTACCNTFSNWRMFPGH
jgi:hypothetical protein